MTFSDALFWVFAAIAVLPAVGILFAKNIVRMAFLLLGSLAGFACLYLHLGAGFVGFTQVMVYIGGILILFLFGVMLTARFDVPIDAKRSVVGLVPGVIAGVVVLGSLLWVVLTGPWGVKVPQSLHDIDGLGLNLLSTYVLPFEAVSVLLLVAMVGASYMARGGNSQGGDEGDGVDGTDVDDTTKAGSTERGNA